MVTASVLALAASAMAVGPIARADDGIGARVAAADSYLAARPGVVGYVLRDRATGAVYRNPHAADPVWTASTIKLAMVVDLLINYTLTRLNPVDTASIVDQLQHVDPNQQWGVWGAGPAMAPGNNDGWSLEDRGWVINSVGFAGKGQRYTLAVMNDLGGDGDCDDGVATTTHLSQLLLAGRDAD